MDQVLWCEIVRGQVDDFRISAQGRHQGLFLRLLEQRQVGAAVRPIPTEVLFFELPEHARDTRVRILYVVHGIVVRLRLRDVEVEVQVLVVGPRDIEEPRSVVADVGA